MKTIIAMLLALTLVGCATKPVVVPVVEAPKATNILAKPPADAMKEPVEPTPLIKGDVRSGNTQIMRQNNLNALHDRQSLRILQAYIRNIFKDEK